MMTNTDEFTVWNNRWTALGTRLTALEKKVKGLKPGVSRRDTIRNLVKRLNTFAEQQFAFFLDGFSNETLRPSPDFPPPYVLKVTLDQIAFDLAVIERILHQRKLKDYKTTLELADHLAWRALKPAVGPNGLIKDEETTVITYFQKSNSIRIIPYAPVALIGIPFTVTDVPRDFLAIPHEVGHYVYRRGEYKPDNQTDTDSLSRVLAARLHASPSYIRNWVEEIFSDVYGCLVAGPVIALDFQDLQLRESKKRFEEDDETHPVPLVRPYIYSNVLERIANYQYSPNSLRTRWEKELEKRKAPESIVPAGASKPVTLDEVRNEINTVINRIFSLLPDLEESWSKDLTKYRGVNDLYTQFEKEYIQTPVEDKYVRELTSEVFDYYEWKRLLLPRASQIEAAAKIFAGTAEDLSQPPDDTWIHVLNANGWTIRGPQGSN